MSGAPEAKTARGLPVAASLALVGAAYAITVACFDPRGLWVVDAGNKLLQLQAVVASGYTDWSLPWPGHELDPDYRFNPLPAPFSRVEDGRLFSFYPPFFPTLSSLPWRTFGPLGLLVVPLLSTLLGLLGLAHAARSLGLGLGSRHAAVLAAGLATPLWFYACTFWEHAPAAALCVWAVAFLLRFVATGTRGSLVAASACATFGAWFRDELVLFCAVLLAAALRFGRGPRAPAAATALASMALCILPLWGFQWAVLGSPLGFHASPELLGAPGAHVADRLAAFYLLFVASGPGVGASWLLAAPFLVAALAGPRLSAKHPEWATPIAAGVALVSGGACLLTGLRADSPVAWLLQAGGFFVSAPLLVLAFTPTRELAATPGWRCVRFVVLGWALVYALASPLPNLGGIHWGNRFLLPLYPLLALLAAANVERWAGLPGARPLAALVLVGLLAALSTRAQIGAAQLLVERRDFSARLSEAVVARPEPVVVTATWWVPQDLFAAFWSKPIFLAESEDELAALVAKLRRAGHREALLVGPRGDPSQGSLVARVDDGNLDFYAVDLIRIGLD